MKNKKLAMLPLIAAFALTGCENAKKPGGNEMYTGARAYYYAFVHSQMTGDKYYHIKGWAEYGPEGGDYNVAYVGLELQLFTSGNVIYYYEQNLAYILMTQYVSSFGEVIE